MWANGYIRAMTPPAVDQRARLLRRGRRLNYATFLYMIIEGGVAFAAGIATRSVALIGFGIDSFIELAAAAAAFWRLAADLDPARRQRVERNSLRVTGLCFLGLAAYAATDAVHALVTHSAPVESTVGIVLACASVVAMPLLGRAKRRSPLMVVGRSRCRHGHGPADRIRRLSGGSRAFCLC